MSYSTTAECWQTRPLLSGTKDDIQRANSNGSCLFGNGGTCSAAEFAPLHDFLRKRGAGGAAPVGDAPVGDEELHFQRGALCGDGRLDLCKQV